MIISAYVQRNTVLRLAPISRKMIILLLVGLVTYKPLKSFISDLTHQ